MYAQRYIQHFPAAGEVVIFDRSWYDGAGVECVMEFVTEDQHRHFLDLCPEIEKYIVDGGTRLIKIWLEVGKEEQEKRFLARINDPLRQWKETEPDGHQVVSALVFTRARYDAQCNGFEARALVCRALRR